MNLNERMKSLLSELIDANLTLDLVLGQVESQCIEIAMQRTKNNVTAASRKLGVHRNTLHNKLRELDWALLRRVPGMKRRGGRS